VQGLLTNVSNANVAAKNKPPFPKPHRAHRNPKVTTGKKPSGAKVCGTKARGKGAPKAPSMAVLMARGNAGGTKELAAMVKANTDPWTGKVTK